MDLTEFLGYFDKIRQANGKSGAPSGHIDAQVTRENLTKLFTALDIDKSKRLDLKEFTQYLGHTEATAKRQQDNIDGETLASLNL